MQEISVGETDRRSVVAMIKLNEAVRSALEASKGRPDNGQIDEQDLDALALLVSGVKDFVVSPFGGVYQKHGVCVVAVIPGDLKGQRANIYAIRIPERGWLLLQEPRGFTK